MSSFRIVDFRFAIKCFDRVDLLLRNLGLPYDTSVNTRKIQILAQTRLFQVPFAKMEPLSDGSFISPLFDHFGLIGMLPFALDLNTG
jgi:hypothetical protein